MTDPSTLSGKALWLRAKDLGANGSSVTSWPDQSGLAHDATPPSTAPTVLTGATPLGGKAVVFAGSPRSLALPYLGACDQFETVDASSTFSSLYLPDFAVNGVTNDNGWNSTTAGVPQWFRVKPRTSTTATSYTIYSPAATTKAPRSWTFEGSADGVTGWVTLDTRSSITFTTSPQTFSFSNSTAYAYYRLNITANNGASDVAIAEFRINGTANTITDSEFWAVIKSDGGNIGLWTMGRSGQTSHYPFSGVVYDDAGAATRQSFTPTLAITSWRTYRVRVSGTTWTAYLDGVSQATATVTRAAATSPYVGYSGSTFYLLGQVAEVLVFNRALTTGEATDVQDYLTAEHFTASGVTGTVAGSSPSTTGAVVGTVPTTGTVAGASPTGAGALAGTVATTGTVAGTSPAGVGSLVGTSDDATTGSVAGTSPAGVGALTGSVPSTGTLAGVSPAGVGELVGTAPTTGTVEGTSPTGAGSLTGDVTIPESELAGTSPSGEGSISGVVGDPTAERTVQCVTYRPVSVIPVVPLVPVTPLADAVPITRVSVLAPNLSAEYPAHPEPGAEGAPEVVEEIIGYPQLFIGGRNVTNLRGAQTVIRKWASEAPFGDTAAAFEFPQKNPWDKPGVGDFDFLTPDARVAIGMREETDPGAFRIRRLWSGFLDARGSSLDETEDYFFEARGTFAQAASQIREPHAITDPVDIGVWIARVLNAVEGRRWATMPLTPIGITTTTRGSRDQYVMDYVQELLSEAITDDFRQWSLVEVAPGVPRLVLKPAPSEVHATVAYGTPGVDISLRVDESTRVDRIFMRGIGRNGGGWANISYPWIGDLNEAPPYPMAELTDYIVLGTTDADTATGSGVTDFQRRVDELDGFANPAVSGVMSAAWMAVVDDLQRRLHITVGPLGPQTWERTFDGRPNPEALKPRRLPMASKIEAEKYLYTAEGKRLPGTNPEWDGRVARDIAIDGGVGLSKAEGFKLARKILGLFGEPAHNGAIKWVTDPRETDRTRLTHLSNIKVTGYEGDDVVVQVSAKSVELDSDDKAYVVTTQVDERARDAMVVEDLLEQRREAKADPSRRPGVTNRSSRQVSDQRMPWDSESVCGRLRRTAVNGASGLWTVKTIPFAEVGKLASIELHADRAFAFAIFASLRITENKLAAIVGDPFATDDVWRTKKPQLDEYGIIEAWGEKDDACGYSPKSEADGGSFTGDFILDTPVDYWTETPPAVAVAFFMRGGSGHVEGRFVPAYEQ